MITFVNQINHAMTDILHLFLSLACMITGFGMIYLFLRKAYDTSIDAGLWFLGGRLFFSIGLVLGFLGLFQAVHNFCLVFNITR